MFWTFHAIHCRICLESHNVHSSLIAYTCEIHNTFQTTITLFAWPYICTEPFIIVRDTELASTILQIGADSHTDLAFNMTCSASFSRYLTQTQHSMHTKPLGAGGRLCHNHSALPQHQHQPLTAASFKNDIFSTI